jgi:AcrR family transcriptional regulator
MSAATIQSEIHNPRSFSQSKILDFNHSYDLIIRMINTKERILDSAETLFGENGYSATSLRHIISEAGVNLAAIHYHFGSKQDLLDRVVLRKAGPINESRLRLLDKFEEDAAPAPACVERVVEAFILPAVLLEKSPEFVKLMGRVHLEGLSEGIAQRIFQPMIARFMSALQRALPDISPNELAWKVHFALGAMAHTLIARPEIGNEAAAEPPFITAKRLVAFISSGFRSSAITEKEIEVNE